MEDTDAIKIIKAYMEGEINNFIKVWLSVLVSLSYCYFTSKVVPKSTITRLLSVLPVISLFLYLPLQLHTMHLGGMTAFFLAWLANFKLLLFAFKKGPLCHEPSLSLPQFIALACLPIRIQQTRPKPLKENPSSQSLNYLIKGLLVALFLRVYDNSEYFHPMVILLIYCLHIYFLLEIMLAIVAAAARVVFGFELEPQFNEPYLSTSLQDFWGRRWNLMVTRVLRPTVYEPVLGLSARALHRKWASLPAVLATFVVSAVMHELMFYYLGGVKPTWEITWFFVLHGVCLVVEIAIKKWVNRKWRLPRVVSGPLTIVFVLATAYWLFLPPLLRCKADERAFREYKLIGGFVKDVGRALTLKYFAM